MTITPGFKEHYLRKSWMWKVSLYHVQYLIQVLLVSQGNQPAIGEVTVTSQCNLKLGIFNMSGLNIPECVAFH